MGGSCRRWLKVTQNLQVQWSLHLTRLGSKRHHCASSPSWRSLRCDDFLWPTTTYEKTRQWKENQYKVKRKDDSTSYVRVLCIRVYLRIYYPCCVTACKASFGSSTVRDCPVSACHVLSAPHLWNALWDPLPPCLCSPASMEHQTSAEIFEMPENPVQQNVCDIATLDFPFSKWFSQFHINIYI